MASVIEGENSNSVPYNPYILNTEITNYSPIPGEKDTQSKQQLRLELIRLETRNYSHLGNQNRTVGVLLVNGKFWSDTIEDSDYGWDQNTPEATIRKLKKANPKSTAIPTGEYYVRLMNGGKFAAKGKPALMISDTPNGADKILGFENVRLHAGANSGFTEGCILIGANYFPLQNQLTSIDSLPFNKEELGGGGNPRWTSNSLRNLIREHGEIATLSVRRNYPVQSIKLNQELNKKNKEKIEQEKLRLNAFKAFRNEFLPYISARPYKNMNPVLPTLRKKNK